MSLLVIGGKLMALFLLSSKQGYKFFPSSKYKYLKIKSNSNMNK